MRKYNNNIIMIQMRFVGVKGVARWNDRSKFDSYQAFLRVLHAKSIGDQRDLEDAAARQILYENILALSGVLDFEDASREFATHTCPAQNTWSDVY